VDGIGFAGGAEALQMLKKAQTGVPGTHYSLTLVQ
jgi:hypothetical protein